MTIPILAHPTRPEIDETLFPDADDIDNNWVEIGNLTNNTDLFSFVDDEVTPDTEGITTEGTGGGRFLEECGSPTDGELLRLMFPDFAETPAGTESFVLTVRARRKDTASSGHTVTIDIDLLQTTSIVASSNGNTLTTSFADVDLVLSQSQVAQLLTDTSDMRINVEAQGCVASAPTGEADCEITMIRLRVS